MIKGPQKAAKIVMFSGGRGTSTISEAITRNDQLSLTLLINAYDDGLSTGQLRRFIPSMLGPSDLRKNTHCLMRKEQDCDLALNHFLNLRLPDEVTESEALAFLAQIVGRAKIDGASYPHSDLDDLSVRQSRILEKAIRAFNDYYQANKQGRDFTFQDCAVGNIVFAGLFLVGGNDFNQAVADYADLCQATGTILNVTTGDPLILCGLKSDGELLPDEATIVAPQNSTSIRDVFLLDDYLTEDETRTLNDLSGPDEKAAWLRERDIFPEPNPEALKALAEADVIIYGPGTQHSSLFPSYLTKGIAEAISDNKHAEKIFISNITHDHDIQSNSVNDLVNSFFYYMSRKGDLDGDFSSLLSTVFVQSASQNVDVESFEPLPFVGSSLNEDIPTSVRDWTFDGKSHSGEYVLKEIIAIATRLIDFQIKPNRNLISIIVPSLDEKDRIGRVLSKLERQQLPWPDINKEIIVVDGGSTDGTVEQARRYAGVRTYDLNQGAGRGAAFMHGVKHARGSIIVMFPSDDEYNPEDIVGLVEPIISNNYRFIIGSRAFRRENFNTQIKNIYGSDNLFGFIVGKYGGMLVSIICLLLFNRFITDPFSTVRAYDANLLKEMNPKATGVEMDAELIAEACVQGEYILEIPVAFRPRKRNEGKKISKRDGLASIWTLIRHRSRKQAG